MLRQRLLPADTITIDRSSLCESPVAILIGDASVERLKALPQGAPIRSQRFRIAVRTKLGVPRKRIGAMLNLYRTGSDLPFPLPRITTFRKGPHDFKSNNDHKTIGPV